MGMVAGWTELRIKGTGKPLGMIAQLSMSKGLWGWRRLWCFIVAELQMARGPTGLCMSTGSSKKSWRGLGMDPLSLRWDYTMILEIEVWDTEMNLNCMILCCFAAATKGYLHFDVDKSRSLAFLYVSWTKIVYDTVLEFKLCNLVKVETIVCYVMQYGHCYYIVIGW